MDEGISNIHESTWKHFDVLITFFIISLRIFLMGFKVLKVLCHMSLKPGNLNFYLFSMCFVNLILSRVSPHLIFFHAEILARSWGTSCSSRPPLLDLFRSLGIAQQTMDTLPLKGTGTQGNPGIPLQYSTTCGTWICTDGKWRMGSNFFRAYD